MFSLEQFRYPPRGGVQLPPILLDATAHNTDLRAKLLSSAAHLAGRSRVSIEVSPRAPSLEEMKAAIDRLHCLSVDGLPPPSQALPDYLQAGYKLLNDYASRISYALSQGRHHAQAAILLPPECKLVQHAVDNLCINTLDKVFQSLLAKHIDFDFIDEESLHSALSLDQRLMIAGEEYELLVLPGLQPMAHETSMKVEEFIEDGGVAVSTDTLLRDGVEELIRPEVSVRLRGTECADIAFTHRTLDGGDMFFFANASDEPREVQMRIRCTGAPCKLDPETGEAWALPNCAQRGSRTFLLHRFGPHESLLVYFGDEPILSTPLQTGGEDERETPLPDKWVESLEPEAVIYSQSVVIPATMRSERVILRVHNLKDVIEFLVNGHHAGTRAWSPFEVEITGLAQPGLNTVRLRIPYKAGEMSPARRHFGQVSLVIL